MPEDNPQNLPITSVTDTKIQKKLNFVKIVLILLLIILLGIGSLIGFSFLTKPKIGKQQLVTGLETANLRLGWTSLSGVYPTDSNPPTIDDNNFNDAIFEALTKIRGSSVVPSIATKWTNPNSTTWRFSIRTGIKFQSGDLLTIDDVKYSFDQVLQNLDDEEKAWPSSNSVGTVKEVKIVDDKTIDIVTTKPDPIFLNRITDVYILSKKQIDRDGIAKAVGTGPFKVVTFEKDTSAELVRFDQYWGEKPKLKKAKFIVYTTDQDLLAALKKNDIDYARIETNKVDLASNFQIQRVDEPRVVMLFFNFAAKTLNGQTNPLLKKTVREAVKYSLDNSKLIKEASVSGKIANQFITKSIVGYNDQIKNSARDVSKAVNLLTEAGVKTLTFDIYTTPDRESVANSISKQLSYSKIKANVVVKQDFGSLVKDLFSGKAVSFIAGPAANDGGEYIDGIFKTDADSNLLSYSSKSVDTAIDLANKSFTPKERKKLLEDLVADIINDVPVVPLYSVTNTFVIRDNFSFETNSFTDFILESISGRKINTVQAN